MDAETLVHLHRLTKCDEPLLARLIEIVDAAVTAERRANACAMCFRCAQAAMPAPTLTFGRERIEPATPQPDGNWRHVGTDWQGRREVQDCFAARLFVDGQRRDAEGVNDE